MTTDALPQWRGKLCSLKKTFVFLYAFVSPWFKMMTRITERTRVRRNRCFIKALQPETKK